MGWFLTINGVVKSLVRRSLQIDATANGRDTLRGSLESADGSYRPALDDEVIAIEDTDGTSTTSLTIATGSRTFAVQVGLALLLGERVRAYSAADPSQWMEGPITNYTDLGALTVTVETVHGAGTYADWVIARRIYGGTLLAPEEAGVGGVGLAPIRTSLNCQDFNAFADHRSVAIAIATGTLKAGLTQFATYFAAYGVTLDPAQVDGPMIEGFTLDWVTLKAGLDAFALRSGYVYEINYYKILRMFDPTTQAAPFNIAAGDHHVISDVVVTVNRDAYVNRVYVLYLDGTAVALAEDVPQQTAHGIWEVVLRAPDVSVEADALAVAAGYLAQHLPTPKQVTYSTPEKGLQVGQMQLINLPLRNLNNSFLITEITISEFGHTDTLERRVTAIEGSVYQAGWRAFYERSGGSAGGSFSGGGGGATSGRRVYFLGGSALEYVQSPTPDWVPASAVEVTIDTVAGGGTSVTVTGRLRATAGTVTARLRNLSDGTTAGTSTAVGTTTWSTVVFGATLTPGSKIYELQVLPSLADTDVAACGYLE